MVRSFTLVLMAVLALLSASEVHAARRHDGHRCRRDAQCLSGTCCNGRCSPQSAVCNEGAGLVDGAPERTGQAKPPAPEKCTGKGSCGACGVCNKGRCTGGDTGRCGSCKVCSQDGSACLSVPDGSGGGPNGYSGCGPDAHGGLQCCSGGCVDTLSNIDNCGGCGIACTGGKLCREVAIGFVGCACRDSETECNGTCANLQTDPNNCGQCGHVCASGACENGLCSCLSSCDGSGNCGGGQADCGPCETCTNGACMPTCGGDQTCCGSGCVDTQTDPNNCGSCGNTCVAGQACCGSGCVDTTIDTNNCGFCGNVCTGGDTCQNGLCLPSLCPDPWFSCGVSYPHVSDVCCLPGNQCCIGGRNTSCYSEGTCCVTDIGDAFICGTGSHCCPHSINVPCLPDGAACPPS
jgi:hypothetical protein